MNASEKRRRILIASEDVVSEKGLSEATISEIAAAAGVSDTYIYQHFKGKEDLVFSILSERENDFFSLLSEHLEGIWDPESRLTKIIWFHLWYFSVNIKYAKVLYFDCLSSLDFYKSRGYKMIRKYAKILLSCLNQGVKEGKFRQDLDMRTVRDIIFGFLGCELLSFMAVHEIDAVIPDLENIVALIMGILKPRERIKETKSAIILNAAEQIFAEKSIYKVRLTEVAKLAGVAEGTVYEYFENKENLLFSISERRLRHFIEDLPDVFEIKDPVRKLRRFTNYYFSTFFSERDFLKTFLIQVQFNRKFYKTEQFTLFLNFFRIIEGVIEEGISKGFFNSNVNPRVFRNMFIGTFNNLVLLWFVINRDHNIDKMQKIDEIANMFCMAVLNSDKPLVTISDKDA
jgi:TetR/AcrR family fatty acid metabolism transcriptional regulator